MKIDLLFLQASTLFFFVASIGLSLLLSNLISLEYPVENWFTSVSRALFSISYLSLLSFAFSLFNIFKFTRNIQKDTAHTARANQNLLSVIKGMTITGALLFLSFPLIFTFAQADDAPGFAIVAIILAGTPLGFAATASLMKRLLSNGQSPTTRSH